MRTEASSSDLSAPASKNRAKLTEEMKALLGNLVAAVDRAEQTGLMDEADKRVVLEYYQGKVLGKVGQLPNYRRGEGET